MSFVASQFDKPPEVIAAKAIISTAPNGEARLTIHTVENKELVSTGHGTLTPISFVREIKSGACKDQFRYVLFRQDVTQKDYLVGFVLNANDIIEI